MYLPIVYCPFRVCDRPLWQDITTSVDFMTSHTLPRSKKVNEIEASFWKNWFGLLPRKYCYILECSCVKLPFMFVYFVLMARFAFAGLKLYLHRNRINWKSVDQINTNLFNHLHLNAWELETVLPYQNLEAKLS